MRKIFLISALIAITAPVMAWGPTGHRVIAQIAYQYLNGKTKKQIEKTLGKNGMIYWVNWPDEIKSAPSIYPTSYDWHFQDLEQGLTPADIDSLIQHFPNHGGRLWTTTSQLLQPNMWKTTQPLPINGEMMTYQDRLVFLIHLIGDCFCPMHMAQEVDKGGNKTKFKWFGEPTNLHNIWDEQLIDARGYSYTEYAQLILITYGNQADSIQQQSPAQLMQTVYNTTSGIYQYYQNGDNNTYHYIWNWHQPCEQLLFNAGVTLARVLNARIH